MHKTIYKAALVFSLFVLASFSCSVVPEPSDPGKSTEEFNTPTSTFTATPSPVPPRLITICMGHEPSSLFLYGDASIAARSVRQAIYDGPFDVIGFVLSPVIMEKVPKLADGDVTVEPVSVQPGSLIVDGNGELLNLGEGVFYRPAGCNDIACALTYSGQEPVQMDQLAVRFKLRPGMQWSDGAPLTADDSRFSFEVAKSFYPRARADLIVHTASYQALDQVTVEWRAVPGHSDAGYTSNFFLPLPRHAWGNLPPEELLTAENSSRMPIGWGPYVIDEWTPGDHISLSRNPNYFRAGEGLPAFDRLVFRFVADGDESLAALSAGECDYLDETLGLESQSSQLSDLQQAGNLALAFGTGAAWEHADFGISPLDSASQPALFGAKETRQAIAMCIDRQGLAEELFFGGSEVPNSYVPSAHPLFYPNVKRYEFDPQAASALFDSVGWLDHDADPVTARLSQGVPGVPDGTPLAFAFLTTDEDEKRQAARIVKESLAECGVQVEVSTLSWETLFAPGPEGPVFGRNFAMAQFGWISALEPPCFLYTSQEIPGPYPQFPKGWGGANASGYINPEYDRVCRLAISTLPDAPEHQAAHHQAQAIFAEDLPAIPLYARLKLVAMRSDMCGVVMDPSTQSSLVNLENFDYGESCGK